MIARRDVGCMNFYETPNSAYQVSNVMKRLEEEKKRQASSMQDSIRQRDKFMNAQLNSASDLRKMLEMMEADQKEQAEENKKNRELALKSYKVSLAAAIFGGASFLAAFITLVLQWLG